MRVQVQTLMQVQSMVVLMRADTIAKPFQDLFRGQEHLLIDAASLTLKSLEFCCQLAEAAPCFCS